MTWKTKQLSSVAKLKSGVAITSREIMQDSNFPVFGGNGLRGYSNKYTHQGLFPIIGRQGALCGNVTLASGQFFASEHAVVVTVNDDIDPLWMYFLLIRMNLNQYSESSAQPGLSVNKISLLPILLPSLPEQTAIATALSDMDALIAQTEKLIEKKKSIKHGMMQQLLSPFDAEGKKKEGWGKKKLGECLLESPEYGINAGAVPFSENLPLYLRITDITDDGKYSKKNIVSVKNSLSSAFFLSRGDLVFARTGASVGKTYLYDEKDGKLVFAGFLIRVRSNPEILLPEYLKYFTQTKHYKEWIMASSMRTGQPGINGRELQELILDMPTKIVEQTRITASISAQEEEINMLEKKIAKQELVRQAMMQSLLTGKIRIYKPEHEPATPV